MLPIGLGVFAGISVIALIVVGLVTYERTKYRRVRFLFIYHQGFLTRRSPFSRRSGNVDLQNLVPHWVMGEVRYDCFSM